VIERRGRHGHHASRSGRDVDRNLILGNFSRAGSGGRHPPAERQRRRLRIRQLEPLARHGHEQHDREQRRAWAGAGAPLADTLYSRIVGNTIVSMTAPASPATFQ